MTDQTPHSDTYQPADPRIERTAVQLAMYEHNRDQRVYGAQLENKFVPWGEAGPLAQEQYLDDARHAVSAMIALGWTPPDIPEFGTRNRASSGGRRGMADDFVLVHDSYDQAKSFAAADPNEELIFRHPARPAGPWISTRKGPETNG